MLRVISADGVDLVEQPPELAQVAAVPPRGGAATVNCSVIEDALPYDYVAGTLYWNDGSQPVVYSGSGTLAINATKTLLPGDYTVRLQARNYRPPVWDTLAVNFQFAVKAIGGLLPESPIIFGPILPKDVGFPNPDQWNWNRGTDIEILASSVKMLLTTSKGERIMQPDYGTNLRAIIFELNTTGIEGLVNQEIVDALTKWEPRVELQFLSVEKTGDREVTVNATFVSKLNRTSTFSIPMVFTP